MAEAWTLGVPEEPAAKVVLLTKLIHGDKGLSAWGRYSGCPALPVMDVLPVLHPDTPHWAPMEVLLVRAGPVHGWLVVGGIVELPTTLQPHPSTGIAIRGYTLA